MKQLSEESQLTCFSVNVDDIYALFEPDNVKDGISLQKLQNLNGINGLSSLLKTNITHGINDKDINEMQDRKIYFGSNDPIRKEVTTLFDMIKECFEDTMLQILCVATIVSTAVGIIQDGIQTGWMEGATIFLAVILIVSVSSGNNYVKEQQFRKLNEKREEMHVHVTRDKNINYIDNKELVVGDLLLLQIGDLLQVDGILVDGFDLKMDESSITGESDQINKFSANLIKNSSQSCFILSGSKVMDGVGKMVVCAVGESTQLGQLKKRLQEGDDPTPLQQKLESIAEDIGYVGTISAALTMIALWIHQGIDIYMGNICFICTESLQELINSFMVAVTIIVVAVPEGLPLAVTISLAFSVNKMKDENNLVKTLDACETMGGCTNICSDKTGTLTSNIMQVQKIYIEDSIIEGQLIHRGRIERDLNQLFCFAVCLNSSANPKKKQNGWEQIGNKTECALLELAYTLGTNYEQFRPTQQEVLRIIPFSSERKKMTTVYQISPKIIRIFVKGSPEQILSKCNRIQIPNQKFIPYDKNKQDYVSSKVISYFANNALRTIAVAYKDIEYTPLISQLSEKFLECDLTLIAITGIKDPMRQEIPEAVKKVKEAGIKIRMVTGDNIETAIAIAKECQILDQSASMNNKGSYEIMEGKKFRELVGGLIYENPDGKTIKEKGKSSVKNMELFKQIISELKVLARSTPEDKYILVTGLKQMDEVVAVTGDGTNDAPALKKADIGFAMGITGSEVAKDAAGIILLDDNFASIVTAVKWGRNIFDSVRKFIQFQLTVNIVALFMSLMGSICLKQSPLNPIQMLWVNMIMDTFASLALATEPPNENLLLRKPYGRNDKMVTSNMWRNIICQAVYQIIILTLILFKIPQWLGIPSSIGMVVYNSEQAVHFSIFFQAFVMMQVFNEINARKLERDELNVFDGICGNCMFWCVIIITIIVQYGLMMFGGKYVGISQLTPFQHLLCFGAGLGSLVNGLIIKLIPNFFFNKLSIFKEQKMEDMDNSLTSKMRRKSSVRMGSLNPNLSRSLKQSELEKQQSDLKKHLISNISINSGTDK